MTESLIRRLTEGNRDYRKDGNVELRLRTAREGQHPYAVVVCCSDSRVIPEQIFSASTGDLFVIRVAGNVLADHQMGSIEYAAEHLGCRLVVMLGHTGCGAVAAALEGHCTGYVSSITDDILEAIGDEKDPDAASIKNVLSGVRKIRDGFASHPGLSDTVVRGAVYDIVSGNVVWL